MTQPTQYTPTTDFSQQEANNASGRSTVNTAALDTEFANVATTLSGLVSNIALLQRDDGRLADLSVEVRCLSQDVLTLMGGFNLRGLWAGATYYAVNDICSSGAYTYCCTTAHTSSGSIDLTKWIQFGFTSGADAAAAAAAAQNSASNAATSATAAANSASAASTSATNAAASAAAAATNASNAVSSASYAATSATNASNSASTAQTAAANLPNAPAAGGDKFLKTNAGGTAWEYQTAEQARASLGLGSAAILTAGTAANNVVQLTAGAKLPAVDGVVPAGTVIFTASSTAPTGFLKANGALVSRTTYAALFAAIGTTFGAGDGVTTFAIPDLRGEHLRGWDDGRGVDAGRVLGSFQADQIKAHTHGSNDAWVGNLAAGSSFQAMTYSPSGVTGSTGGTENRVRNIALLACIKF